MEKKIKKKAEKIIKEFFKKTTFDVNVEVQEEADALKVKVASEEGQTLIGQGGGLLGDFQKILGRILRKQLDQEIFLHLDINQYKESKEKYLFQLARELADKVSLEGKEHVLFPMTAFERRVVHTALLERGDVSTESRGEGKERRVVIKPV